VRMRPGDVWIRAGHLGVPEFERAQDAAFDFGGVGVSGDPLDDQPEQKVVGARVGPGRPGLEQRRLTGDERQEVRR
jgi:hypothetical protein